MFLEHLIKEGKVTAAFQALKLFSEKMFLSKFQDVNLKYFMI